MPMPGQDRRNICVSFGNAGLVRIREEIDSLKNRGVGLIELRFDIIDETAPLCRSSDITAIPGLVMDEIKKTIQAAANLGLKTIAAYRSPSFNTHATVGFLEKTTHILSSAINYEQCDKDNASLSQKCEFSDNSILDKSNSDKHAFPCRINFLKLLAEETLIDIMDIELDELDRSVIKRFVDFIHGKGKKAILSVHNFNGKIDEASAVKYYIDSRYFKADFFKLVDSVSTPEDATLEIEKNHKLLSVKSTEPALFPSFIVFGMGEKGVATRVLSSMNGSEFSYCSSLLGNTAAGQISVDDFNRLYEGLS